MQKLFNNSFNFKHIASILVVASSVGIVNAQTANQLSALNYIKVSAGDPAVNTAIATTSGAEQNRFLNSFSAATYANQQVALAHIDQQFQNEIADRLDGYIPCQRIAQEQIFTKDIEIDVNEFTCDNQLWWVSAYGGEDNLLSSEGISGLRSENYGGALGSEFEIMEGTVLGFALSYNNFSEDAQIEEKAHMHGQLYQFGVYGRQDLGNLRFGGSFDYAATNHITADRIIFIPEADAEVLGSYMATVIAAQARASYQFIPYDNVSVRPVLGAIYQRVQRHRFTETTFTGYELEIVGQQYTSLRSILGANLELQQEFFRDLFPFLYLAWEHEFADENSKLTGGLLVAQGGMEIIGTELGRNALALKTGFIISENNSWELSVQYEGRYAKGFAQNGGRLELSYF